MKSLSTGLVSKRRYSPVAMLLGALLALFSGCSGDSEATAEPALGSGAAAASHGPAAPDGSEAEPLPLEPRQHVRYALLLYSTPKPLTDPERITRETIAEQHAVLQILEPHDESETDFGVKLSHVDPGEYPPPSRETIQHFGRGVSAQQAEDVQSSEAILAVSFQCRVDRWAEMLRISSKLMHTVAARTGGLIWDDETRELFTPEVWSQQRLSGWHGDLPDITHQATIHAYPHGELLRIVTLGMTKLGQPDLVINDCPRGFMRQGGVLINLVAQTLVERDGREVARVLQVDIDALSNDGFRQVLAASLEPGSQRSAAVSLEVGQREEGDPWNDLIEITFHSDRGGSLHERQSRLFDDLLGSRDEIVGVERSVELDAASKRAVEALMADKRRFQQGLSPNERLLVKFPFRTSTGDLEYMWVEVVDWKGTSIDGIQMNEPRDVPALVAGAEVSLDEAQAYDYLFQQADGTMTGNETGKVIERLQARR